MLPACIFSLAYTLDPYAFPSLPKITFEDLKNTLNSANVDALDKLNDEGGKMGAIVIDGLGYDYKMALQDLILNAPECMDLLTEGKINVAQLPDSSYRKTYATMDGQYPDCLNLQILSDAFDNVDALISKLLSRKINQGSSISSTVISYQFEGQIIPIDAAPIKEHVHVYDRSSSTSNYMVPFHVDNGIYLIITPFEGHGLKLRLSSNKVVSTEGLETDSVIVLFGRGLTDWLLQDKDQKADMFHAVPHAVPTTSGETTLPRTVYARMKVAQPSATPIIRQEASKLSSSKTFEEMFMEARDSNYPDTSFNNLCPMSASTKQNEIWLGNMRKDCEEGKAFCWMSCLPLPAECPDVQDAMCYNEVTDEPCFDDSMDPLCAWHCI